MEGVMGKSMREARLHGTWASLNGAYEEAMLRFLREADASRAAFLDALARLPQQPRADGAETDSLG
jgi:maltooligosyltrehalose synthase